MQAYEIFKDLAIILVTAKLFGILARKLNAPQVVGEIVAGLILGPSVLGIVNQSDFLSQMAEIGVILIMFSAGLGTNLKDLKKSGGKAFLIACIGVLVPLICGTLLYMAFYKTDGIGSESFFRAVFIGVILTATSVSITVRTLSELGKLKSELGTLIVSAAIIDDIIGVIVLTVIIGLGNGSGNEASIPVVLLKNVGFFAFVGVAGFLLYKLFKLILKHHSHTHRVPIFGLALCMALAYIAEKFFGVADITGAFAAGVILCNIRDSEYIEEKIDINSYMLFGPVFFAGIGLKTNLQSVSLTIIAFAICFVIVALVSKIIGCGITAKLCGYSKSDSLKVGVGMMTRGEVALIVAQKGLNVGLLDSAYFAPVILLIITSSILTPIILKAVYNRDEKHLAVNVNKQP